MPLTPATAEIPLVTDAEGVVRVGATRVTPDSVVGAFRADATPEKIAHQFPASVLADVYQVIAYHLKHTSEVDSYLAPCQKRLTRRGVKSRAASIHGECARGSSLDGPPRQAEPSFGCRWTKI